MAGSARAGSAAGGGAGVRCRAGVVDGCLAQGNAGAGRMKQKAQPLHKKYKMNLKKLKMKLTRIMTTVTMTIKRLSLKKNITITIIHYQEDRQEEDLKGE